MLLKFFKNKTSDFAKALKEGEITKEILIKDKENMLVCGNGVFVYKDSKELSKMQLRGGQTLNHAKSPSYSNFHFQDIFGNYHRFFRPYTYKAKELIVRILPNAYASGDIDLVFTASKKALLSYTTYREHILYAPQNLAPKQAFIKVLRLIKNWLRFFYSAKVIHIQGNMALLYREVGNYGHFIREVIVGLEQIKRSGVKIDYYLLPLTAPYHKQMLALLNIPESKVIKALPHTLFQASNLIIPTLLCEYEIVEYRENLHFRTLTQSSITPFIYDNLPIAYKEPKRKIFLSRPKDSNRNIENANEVEAIFKDFGFEVILPDILSLREQIEMMRETKILAGMHGSGLDNVLFANRGIAVFVLFSEYYHDSNPQLSALLKGCKYFYIVGKTTDISMHPQKESVYFEPRQIKKALEIMQQYVEF